MQRNGNRKLNKPVRKVARKAARTEVKREVQKAMAKNPRVRTRIPRGRGAITKRRQGPISAAFNAYGPTLANIADRFLNKIVGDGDYRIGKNSIMGRGVPQMSNYGINGTRIQFTEYLGDVSAETSFTTTRYSLNPGDADTFPWLNGVAKNYEEYEFHGVVFFIKSTSSNAVLSSAASTSLGSYGMATQYDPYDDPFLDKREILNYEFAKSCAPSSDLLHPIECARKQTTIPHRYVRTGAPPNGADLRLYDWGVTTLFVEGMQNSGGHIGELYITYDVELYKPKLVEALSQENGFAIYNGVTPSASNPFGTSRVEVYDDIHLTITNNTVSFPPSLASGSYKVDFYWYGDTGATTVFASPTYTNLSLKNIYHNSSTGLEWSGGSSVQIFLSSLAVTITAAGASIQLGTNGTYPTTNTAMDIIVSAIPTAAFQKIKEDKELFSYVEPRLEALFRKFVLDQEKMKILLETDTEEDDDGNPQLII